jgi:hypothetical protein
MPIFLIIAGIVSLIYGTIIVLGRTKNDVSKDSQVASNCLPNGHAILSAGGFNYPVHN